MNGWSSTLFGNVSRNFLVNVPKLDETIWKSWFSSQSGCPRWGERRWKLISVCCLLNCQISRLSKESSRARELSTVMLVRASLNESGCLQNNGFTNRHTIVISKNLQLDFYQV